VKKSAKKLKKVLFFHSMKNKQPCQSFFYVNGSEAYTYRHGMDIIAKEMGSGLALSRALFTPKLAAQKELRVLVAYDF
jgi:hypothetical protein